MPPGRWLYHLPWQSSPVSNHHACGEILLVQSKPLWSSSRVHPLVLFYHWWPGSRGWHSAVHSLLSGSCRGLCKEAWRTFQYNVLCIMLCLLREFLAKFLKSDIFINRKSDYFLYYCPILEEPEMPKSHPWKVFSEQFLKQYKVCVEVGKAFCIDWAFKEKLL